MLEHHAPESGAAGGPPQTPFPEGTPVYDATGAKVGTVREHNVQDGYLVLHRGPLRPDVSIPLSAIGRTSSDGIHLNIAKGDELDSLEEDARAREPTVESTGIAAPAFRASGGTAETARAREVDVPVHEEELVAEKQRQETGRVHLRKEVDQEREDLAVPLTHEAVHVDHVPIQDADQNLPPDAFTEKEFDLPVMGEEIAVSKQARVVEEVHLRKEPVTEQRQVSDTVRKERVEIRPEGEVDVQGLEDQEHARGDRSDSASSA